MAKIDVTKIEKFNELTADELRDYIKGYEYEDNGKELSELKTQVQKLSKAKDDATSEAAEFKRQLREKQSEAERAEAERLEELTRLKTENEEFKRASLIGEYKAQALGMGYSEELAGRRAEAMANNDYKALAEVDKAFIVEHDKEIASTAMKNTPKPPTGATNPDGAGEVTKEQFDKMSYGERASLYESNPDLYNELNSQD